MGIKEKTPLKGPGGVRPQWKEQAGVVRTGWREIFNPHEVAGAAEG